MNDAPRCVAEIFDRRNKIGCDRGSIYYDEADAFYVTDWNTILYLEGIFMMN